jgi:hypothetical protein
MKLKNSYTQNVVTHFATNVLKIGAKIQHTLIVPCVEEIWNSMEKQ